MQDRILAQDSTTDNPFDSFTADEQAEYDAWTDECKSKVRDPLPEDFPEQLEYDRIKESTRIRMEANGQKEPETTERCGRPDEVVVSDNFPISDDDTLCDCGAWHTFTFHLNAATGNWLCRTCVEKIQNADRKRKQVEDAELQAAIERIADPKKMFAAFLHTKRSGGTS